MMNPVVKKKWIAALRSGKWTQGRWRLGRMKSSGREHCCLGVLCELAAVEGVAKIGVDGDTWTYDLRTTNLPERVTNWANLSLESEHVGTLIGMNDSGEPFTKIADYIEEHL
jgi:hypothetical protein